MQLTPKVKTAGLALALAAVLFGVSSCSNKKVDEQLGLQLRMLSPIDNETAKQIVADSAPIAGQSTITVVQTVRYLHMDITGISKNYSMKRSYTAEYVERLNGWMVYDDDGSLYRFTAGNTIGTMVQKQTFDIGAQAKTLADNDRFKVLSVTAQAGVAADPEHRTLVVVRGYKHTEQFDNLSYTVTTETPADRVELQNAWMSWVDGSLYRLDQSGALSVLKEKPLATIGTQDKKLSESDQPITKNSVAAGPVAAAGTTRELIVTRDFNHEEQYQHLHYTLVSTVSADWVAEQKAFMAIVDYALYSASPDGQIAALTTKPTFDMGERTAQLDKNDYSNKSEVIPTAVSANKQGVVVTIRRTYLHNEKYQLKQYRIDSKDTAAYSDQYKDWYIEVDGRNYVITFPGDTPTVPRFVTVVKAPTGLERPQVPAPPPVKGAAAGDKTSAAPASKTGTAPAGKAAAPPVVVSH